MIVTTECMENYVRDNYPTYGFIKSIVNFFNSPEKINIDLINDWSKDDIVVLPFKLNNNFKELKKLKYPEHIEVLCNQPCIENCPFTMDHYLAFNKINLYLPTEPFEKRCRFKSKDYDNRNTSFYVSYELIPKYNEVGINHFKIAGRDVIELALRAYCEFFIKSEYKELLKNYLSNITLNDFSWSKFRKSLEN